MNFLNYYINLYSLYGCKNGTKFINQAVIRNMGKLFNVSHAIISEHITNIFSFGGLDEKTSIGISDKSSNGKIV